MKTVEQLKELAEQMFDFLNEKYQTEPEVMIGRLNRLSTLIPLAGQCLADARYFQDTVVNGAIMEAIQKAYEEKLSPSTINKFVTTAARDQNHLVNTFDRIGASAVHQQDSIRTILSYKKAELQLV
jgi:hypothetical protein